MSLRLLDLITQVASLTVEIRRRDPSTEFNHRLTPRALRLRQRLSIEHFPLLSYILALIHVAPFVRLSTDADAFHCSHHLKRDTLTTTTGVGLHVAAFDRKSREGHHVTSDVVGANTRAVVKRLEKCIDCSCPSLRRLTLLLMKIIPVDL